MSQITGELLNRSIRTTFRLTVFLIFSARALFRMDFGSIQITLTYRLIQVADIHSPTRSYRQLENSALMSIIMGYKPISAKYKVSKLVCGRS